MNRPLMLSMLCIISATGSQTASAFLIPFQMGPRVIITRLVSPIVGPLAGLASSLVHRKAQMALSNLATTGYQQAERVAEVCRGRAGQVLQRLQGRAGQAITQLEGQAGQAIDYLGDRVVHIAEQGLKDLGLIQPKRNPWEAYLIPAGIGVASVTTGVAAILLYKHLSSSQATKQTEKELKNAPVIA